MGRFRNPRYAPEWLESRLSPSAVVAAVPAEVSTTSGIVYSPIAMAEEPLPTDSNGDPIPEPAQGGDGPGQTLPK